MDVMRVAFLDILLALPGISYSICSYLLLWQPLPDDEDRIADFNPEVFRRLAAFRTASSSLCGLVNTFLHMEEGKSFARLALAFAERTEHLRMGVEDVISHFNQALYGPSAIFPHIHALRSQFQLNMQQLVTRYFRWFQAIPSCLIPQWAMFPLEDELFNYCADLRFRCPMLANYLWPSSVLHFGGAQVWPPRPLQGIAWGSTSGIIVIGHLSGRSGELIIPTWAPNYARSIFFRHATLDGRIFN